MNVKITTQKSRCALPLILSLIFSAFLLVSCNNIFGNGVSEIPPYLLSKQYVNVSGHYSVSGAFPKKYYPVEALTASRSAIPSLPSSVTVKAKASASGYTDIETTLADGATSFTISGLETDATNPVTWTITVTMYDGTTPILSDSCSKTLTLADPLINHDFILKQESSSGTGDVSLEMTIPDTVSSISLSCPSSSWTINSATVSDTSATISASSLAAGAYEVSMIFKNSAGYILYTDVQTINVFSGMTTDTWVNGVATGPVSGGAYTLTEALIADAARTMLYVGTTSYGDASDTTGNGSVFAPFETIAKACSFITATGDASKNYTIFLTGTLTGAQTIEGLTAEVEGVIVKKANSLTIIGASGLDGTGRPRDSLDGEHVTPIMLTVDTIVPVTLKEILISRATNKGIFSKQDLTLVNCEISNNAQGLHSWNKLTVKNCKITQNTNKGIYIAPTEVLIQDSEISYNSTSDEGGGIYIEDIGDEEVSVEINGCTISYNGASYAGGIYDFNSPVKIHDTIIESNTADGCDMNGGGIYLKEPPSEGNVELTGTTVIKNNACTDGGVGGAIYSSEVPVYIKDSVYIPSGTDNTNDVYFYSTDAKFVINGSLNLPAAAGGIAAFITPYYHIEGTQVLDASNTTLLESEYNKFVVNKPSPNSELLFIGNDGKLFSPVTFDNGTYLTGTGSSVLHDDGNYYRVANYSFLNYDKMTMSVANPYGAGLSLTTTVDSEPPISGAISASELSDGYHTIVTTLTKLDGTTESGTKRVLVKIKPVKVTLGQIVVYLSTAGQGVHSRGVPYIGGPHYMYIEGDPYPTSADYKKTCITIENDSYEKIQDGDNACRKYCTPEGENSFVYLTDKNSTFYFYTNVCRCTYMETDLCKVNRGNTTMTRTLSSLKPTDSRHFVSGDINSAGNSVSSGPRGNYWFYVSLDDTTSP